MQPGGPPAPAPPCASPSALSSAFQPHAAPGTPLPHLGRISGCGSDPRCNLASCNRMARVRMRNWRRLKEGSFRGAAGAPMLGAGCSCSHKALPWEALTVIKTFPELTSLIQPFFCSF